MARARTPNPKQNPSADGSSAAEGVRVSHLEVGGERFVVISVPIERSSELSRLSDAERKVAELVLLGMSNDEIARARGVALRTVANQVASILRKMQVSSRFELIAQIGSGSPLGE